MNDLKKSFNERAYQYDQWIQGICPYYEDALKALIYVLPARAHFILELGCGTGNLSVRLLEKYPHAQLTVVDISPIMLEVTKQKVKKYENQVSFVEKHFESFQSKYRFDIIVSSLAIHHVDTKGKERLFDTVFKMLEANGYFYIVDSVYGASKEIERINHQVWIDYMKSHDVPDNEIQNALQRREEHDKCDPLFLQLGLLKKAGFVAIDVIWKYYGIAVFGARKY